MGMERKGLGARGLRLNLCPAQKKSFQNAFLCLFLPVAVLKNGHFWI
jgi:hypothetical protein